MNWLKAVFFFCVACLVYPVHAATPVGSCNFTLTSMPGLSYSVVAPSQTQAANLNINCTSVLTVLGSYAYTVSYGAGSSGNVANRSMQHASFPTSLLGYTLRQTSSVNSTLLGNGTGGTSTQTGVLNCLVAVLGTCLSGATQVDLRSWLHVPARQFVRPGNYADSVVVTVTIN